MAPQRTQNFNSIRLTTSNNVENNIILSEVSGKLFVNSSPVAISGDFNAANLSDYNFDGNSIEGFAATVVDETSTSYTLSTSDAGKMIIINNAENSTVTVPQGFSIGFNCSFLQKGAGSISFSASGTTINNRQSHTQTAGQYAIATLICYDTDTFVLAGDTVE
jgi:hypothetical protein